MNQKSNVVFEGQQELADRTQIFLDSIQKYACKSKYQFLFESLYKVALIGMNSFASPRVAQNGEEAVFFYVIDKLRNTKTNPMMIFDVGACKGEWADVVVKYTELEKKEFILHLFEPSAINYDHLQYKYQGVSYITNHHIGFHELEGKFILFSNEPGSPLGTLLRRGVVGSGKYDCEAVSEESHFTTIDKFCEKHGITEIDYLKIDAEGIDLSVLKGAERMLNTGGVKALTFEFGGANIESKTYMKDFFKLLNKKFTLHRIVCDGLVTMPEHDLMNELITGVNILALSRDVSW